MCLYVYTFSYKKAHPVIYICVCACVCVCEFVMYFAISMNKEWVNIGEKTYVDLSQDSGNGSL